MDFDRFIGIDYSGAQTRTSRLKGLQVYAATDGMPERIPTPAAPAGRHRNWCREEIAAWIVDQAAGGRRFVAGLDHGFSFPETYFERYGLTSWDEFLEDFAGRWPTHEEGVTVESLREANRAHTGKPDEFRLCDKWTSSAKSVFDFRQIPGIVAKSTHAGIPWLWHMRNEVGNRVHFWPFDGWEVPAGKSAIVEVYPSIFRNRYSREGRSPDEHDAYSVARWLKETCDEGFLERYLDPPLTQQERHVGLLEGWILGIT